MRWLLSLLACLHFVVLADDAERARIAAERQALVEGFVQEERECQQRFAVTACLDDVRSRRRAALAPLRARELKLDEADRQQRAAERRAAIEAKQRARAALPTTPPQSPVLRSRQAVPSAPAASATPATPAAAAAPAASAASAAVVERRPATADSRSQAARAAERAQAAQRRRDEAEATRVRVEKRLAEREAAGKTVSPLPVPGSAPGR